jgi:Flp pilus assembly protein TadG
MVEFVLVLPALLLILLAIMQLGIVFKNYVTLTDAVRAGARKAAVSRRDPCPVCVATAAVKKSGAGLGASLVVTVTPSPWAAGSDVTVSATYDYSVDLLGLVLHSGKMTSSTTERVE